MLFDFILLVLYLISSYKFFCGLHQMWINAWWKDKIHLYQVDFKSFKSVMNPEFAISGLSTLVLILINKNALYLSLKMALLMFYIIRAFVCSPDENDVLEMCNLNIGFGAALWYYKNYLTSFLPDNFRERVNTFETLNKVHVEKKLFILVPESCIVLKYLDNDETEGIERCQELPKFEKPNSGLKKRTYNITIYLVRTNSGSKRMAVEYAQPLKGIFFLYKDCKFLTKSEMYYQRKLFVKSLREFLKDQNDSYKFCKIIEYKDNEKKVSDVLMEHCQFEDCFIETV